MSVTYCEIGEFIMRIFGYYDNITKVCKIYLRQSSSVEQKLNIPENDKLNKTDELIISLEPIELQKYEELARSIPEIQEDKTRSIKTQFESGEYNIDSKSIAKSIINLKAEINLK
jgi:negative regulator of flagellin synthesis FlgM